MAITPTPGRLLLVAYAFEDPSGDPLGELTEATERTVFQEDNVAGGGSLRVNRHSEQAAWCEPGAYIRAWRDEVAGAALAGFWVEERGDVLVSPDEQGGEEIGCSGRGPEACLREARVWYRAVSGGTGQVQTDKGRWYWPDAHPARPLIRMLEEAQARGCLPFVSWDFTRNVDSDGNPWTGDSGPLALEIGIHLLDALTVIRESGLHVVMSPDFVLSAWDEYERDLSGSIVLEAGVDIRDTSERSASIRRKVGAMMVEGETKENEPRYRAVSDSDIIDAQGRRIEGFYPWQRTANGAVLERVARRKLRKWARQADASPLVIGTVDQAGAVALVDYVPGDTIGIAIDGYEAGSDRIGRITLRETAAGEYDPIVDFGDVSLDSAPYIETGGGAIGGPSAGGGAGGGGGAGTVTDESEYLWDGFDREADSGDPLVVAVATTDSYSGPEGEGLIEIPVPAGAEAGHLLVVTLGYDNGAWKGVYDTLEEGTPAGWTLVTNYYLSHETGAFGHVCFAKILTGDEEAISIPFFYSAETAWAVHRTAWRRVLDWSVRETLGTEVAWGWGGSAVVIGDNETDNVLETIGFGPQNRDLITDRGLDGGTPSTTGWLAMRVAPADDVALGSLPTSDITGAWWLGGNPWTLESAVASYELDGVSLIITATEPDQDFAASVHPPPALPQGSESWTMSVALELTGTFDAGDDGERRIRFVIQAGDVYGEFDLRLGDSEYPAGLLVAGAGNDSLATSVSDGTPYWWRFGIVGGLLVAKLWEQSGDEPEDWAISIPPLDYVAGPDGVTLAVLLGGESGDQSVAIAEISARLVVPA